MLYAGQVQYRGTPGTLVEDELNGRLLFICGCESCVAAQPAVGKRLPMEPSPWVKHLGAKGANPSWKEGVKVEEAGLRSLHCWAKDNSATFVYTATGPDAGTRLEPAAATAGVPSLHRTARQAVGPEPSSSGKDVDDSAAARGLQDDTKMEGTTAAPEAAQAGFYDWPGWAVSADVSYMEAIKRRKALGKTAC